MSRQGSEDLLALDLQERVVITLPHPIGINLPLLIKLSDIKYKEVSLDVDILGVTLPEINALIMDKSMKKVIDTIFDVVEWDAVDIEGLIQELYTDSVLTTLEDDIELPSGFKDYYTYDKCISSYKEQVIYNLKEILFNYMCNYVDFEQSLYVSVTKIQKTRENLLIRFNEIIERLLKVDNKTLVFDTAFLVMCKMAITRGLTIFPENLHLATTEYSYREIKVRLMFENVESIVNTNRMVAFHTPGGGSMI